MKINRESNRFYDYSANLEKKCGAGVGKSTGAQISKPNKDPVASGLPVKVQPVQQFRQDRNGGQKPLGTSLGWRTYRSSQRNADSDKHR